MIESPKRTPLDLGEEKEKSSGWKAVQGIAVLSGAGFCIFALSAYGWHIGVALADLTMRLCHS